jgi:hypothetical protein
MRIRVFAWAVLAALTACALPVEPRAPAPTGFADVEFALSGTFPNVQFFTVRIFEGALTDLTQPHKYAPAVCQPYLDPEGKPRNKLTISKLKLGTYALLVDLFEDNKCSKLRYRAFRGGLAVKEGAESAAAARPYYVQPYEIGKFTGLAGVFQGLLIEADKKICTSETDCKGVHVNATCNTVKSRCTVDHMFPFNGGDRRALGLSHALADGRVVLAGGFTAPIAGTWVATKDRAEVFEPSLGLFRSTPVANAGPAVGLAESVTLAGSALAVVGGSSGANLAIAGGKLTAALDTRGCVGGNTACAVSRLIARWDLAGSKDGVAQQFLQAAPLAFPAVARVRTKEGERLLVAGGAPVPLSKTGDPRSGSSVVCKIDAAAIDCAGTVPSMATARARAASACLLQNADGTCGRLLVLGGRKAVSAPLAEIYDADTNTWKEPLYKGSKPGLLHGGALLQLGGAPAGGSAWLLAGATGKALFLEDTDVVDTEPLPLLRVTVTQEGTDTSLDFAAVDLGVLKGTDGGLRAFPATAALTDGSVLIMGGIGKDLKPLKDALVVGPAGVPKARLELGVARLGGTASRVPGKGPLGGCVMLAGGFALDATGLVAQNHVEVMCPN